MLSGFMGCEKLIAGPSSSPAAATDRPPAGGNSGWELQIRDRSLKQQNKSLVYYITKICVTDPWTCVTDHVNSKIQLNFIKANFIKTNNSLRRSKSSVPNRVLLILTKIQLFKSKYLCRTFYVSKHIFRSLSGVFFIKSNG